MNAANEALVAGAGVCGAIRRAGGDEIFDECARLGGCATGDAKATGGGRLPARYVIHAVGPVWSGGDRGEALLLASAYRRSLEVAEELGCRTIAFPALSTGIYGYPTELAAPVAIGRGASVREPLRRDPLRFSRRGAARPVRGFLAPALADRGEQLLVATLLVRDDLLLGLLATSP